MCRCRRRQEGHCVSCRVSSSDRCSLTLTIGGVKAQIWSLTEKFVDHLCDACLALVLCSLWSIRIGNQYTIAVQQSTNHQLRKKHDTFFRLKHSPPFQLSIFRFRGRILPISHLTNAKNAASTKVERLLAVSSLLTTIVFGSISKNLVPPRASIW